MVFIKFSGFTIAILEMKQESAVTMRSVKNPKLRRLICDFKSEKKIYFQCIVQCMVKCTLTIQ